MRKYLFLIGYVSGMGLWVINLVALFYLLIGAAACFGGQQEAPAVVMLQNSQGLCSGVCVDPAGIILTAKHCKHGETVKVTFPGGRSETGVRIYKGPGIFDGVTVYDIPGDDWPSIRVAQSPPRPGDEVWLCGYPAGRWESWRASVLTESMHLTGERFTVVNKATRPGWSGGPLINKSGQVVGLLSHTDAGYSGNSYFIDHRSIAKAYTQICDGIRCSPPGWRDNGNTKPELPPPPGQPRDQAESDLSEFEGVVVSLMLPEMLEGASGRLADIVAPDAFGVPGRMVKQVSGGKARFVGISQRAEPAKYQAAVKALGLPGDQPSLVALIPKTSQGLIKGLVVKKIESEILSRLNGVIFSPVFERVSSADYQAGLTAVSQSYSADLDGYERGGTIIERAKQAAIDEIRERLPDQSEIVAGVAGKLRDRLPDNIKEKTDQAAGWWEIYQRGGLALLLVTALGARVQSHLSEKSRLAALAGIVQSSQDKGKASQLSSQSSQQAA